MAGNYPAGVSDKDFDFQDPGLCPDCGEALQDVAGAYEREPLCVECDLQDARCCLYCFGWDEARFGTSLDGGRWVCADCLAENGPPQDYVEAERVRAEDAAEAVLAEPICAETELMGLEF